MSAVVDVEWGECLVAPVHDAALERDARKAFGVPYDAVRYFAKCPWLARAFIRSNLRNGNLAHLDHDLSDLIFLAVSQDNSCRYCYASQRAQLRILGFDTLKIRAIEQASYSAQFEPRDRLTLEFARRFSRANPAPSADDEAALVDAGHSIDAVREAAFVAANAVIANRITTLLALPLGPIEGAEDRWTTRLLRPLIARMIRSARRPGHPEPLPEALTNGPFAYVGRALDGLPVATIQCRTLDEAWESEILSRRLKGLVFAIVARGLGSKRVETEATQLLAADGMDPAQTADVLAHLGSPELDPIEAAVVPFARETVRYRPEDIQRRAGELRGMLSEEEFLELVGIVALANATGRLSLMLCER
jgi:AhpD family alkylhydroperoxidase